MEFFKKGLSTLLDLLFPKREKTLTLESLSASELLERLPKSESSKDFVSLFDYRHTLTRELIWELKYKGNPKVAETLAELLFDTLLAELEERGWSENWQRPILIPTPVSEKRRFERGFNQCELLCQAIKRLDRGEEFKYLPRQLVKNYHTESQTKTGSRAERLANIKGSMRVLHPESVRGRVAVVVDDVATTGATFAEAKRALKVAGVKKILCVALAH